jgi:hypothetical protein
MDITTIQGGFVMRKNKLVISLCVIALAIGLFILPAQATIFVPSYGETGWQSFTIYYTGSNPFTGFANWLVANTIDTALNSELLLDNISQNALGNPSFETGNYTGYVLGALSNGQVVGSSTSSGGNTYLPTNGSFLSSQFSFGDNAGAFQNATGAFGTDGSFLKTPIIVFGGGSFSFDWAFLAHDYFPFTDFAAFYITDCQGNQVWYDVLAQIGPSAPVPPSILLLGSALLGLVGLRRKLS